MHIDVEHVDLYECKSIIEGVMISMFPRTSSLHSFFTYSYFIDGLLISKKSGTIYLLGIDTMHETGHRSQGTHEPRIPMEEIVKLYTAWGCGWGEWMGGPHVACRL